MYGYTSAPYFTTTGVVYNSKVTFIMSQRDAESCQAFSFTPLSFTMDLAVVTTTLVPVSSFATGSIGLVSFSPSSTTFPMTTLITQTSYANPCTKNIVGLTMESETTETYDLFDPDAFYSLGNPVVNR